MKKQMVTLLAGAMLMMASGIASAYSISYSQLTPNQSTVTNSVDGWSASAAGGKFQVKSQDGWSGVGISGKTGGEIDTTEALTFTFNNAQLIKDFDLTLLFSAGPYGDPNEVAGVLVNNTDWYFLTAKYPTTAATWTGAFASSSTLSSITGDANVTGGAAVWNVLNPFGNTSVTSLKFTAISAATSGNDSDYTFNSLETAPVPEPGTIALLGLGLAGLAVFGKRRQSKKA